MSILPSMVSEEELDRLILEYAKVIESLGIPIAALPPVPHNELAERQNDPFQGRVTKDGALMKGTRDLVMGDWSGK